MFGVKRIDGRANAAQDGDGVEGDGKFRNVRTENAKDVMGLKPARGQPGSRTTNGIGKLGISYRSARLSFY